MPEPQTDKQKSVQQRIQELANAASNELGVDRRTFLASSGGLAAAFLAMNEVFGPHFNVSAAETISARRAIIFNRETGLSSKRGN